MIISRSFHSFIQSIDRTAETAVKCVVDFFLKFGIPRKLYSDRDPSYEAKLFQLLMKELGGQKVANHRV